jgi:hypothetical protein
MFSSFGVRVQPGCLSDGMENQDPDWPLVQLARLNRLHTYLHTLLARLIFLPFERTPASSTLPHSPSLVPSFCPSHLFANAIYSCHSRVDYSQSPASAYLPTCLLTQGNPR